jgi:DNA polymerase
VAGDGPAPADVALVTGAPGPGEDALGAPLAGRAARLIEELLGRAGIDPAGVWITPLVKCRPPGNRDPAPVEVASCSEHLVAQLEAVRPVVVVALGGAVSKLLRGSPEPIRARHGREEPRVLGDAAFWLLPVFDPGAALYAPALAEQLAADLARLPALVARGRPALEPPAAGAAAAPTAPAPVPGQLGLF